MPNFPENEHVLPPDTHTYVCVSGSKKCLFFRKFGVFCFLETSVLRLPFYLITVVITVSKAHEVVTKMTEVEISGGGTIDMWTLNQKISGLVFIKPNIPALKYDREMETKVANTFKGNHKIIKLSNCGLIVDETLQYLGVSPDIILLCSCYVKGCVEIECPYSINYTKSCYSNLEHLQLCDGKTLLKKSEKLHKITHRGCYWNYKIIFLFELTTA